VTRHFALVGVVLVAATALVMLLLALLFVPLAQWEAFVPLATLVAVLGALMAAVVIERIGERMVRPLRRLARTIEDGRVGELTLDDFGRQAPAEVAPLLYGLHVTHARLRRILGQLEQDRAEVGTIFEHMTDGVVVLDGHEHVVLSNPAADRMVGGSIGVDHPELLALMQLARGGSEDRPVMRLLELDGPGERRWVQAIATRLPEDRQLLVLQDISDLRRAEAARRDFVANVSHELRTPVAALKALVETLEQGAIDDPLEGPEFLRLMHTEVDGLAQLIAELLELARAEAGRLELHLAPCRAEELVSEAAERARPAARQANLHVEVAVDREAPLWVDADSRRIGQVLSNLLGNATKFTPPDGRIEVGARCAGERVELWVADTGVGIETAQLSRVFERFYKTDPSRAAGTGTGLGLAIAKHLVLAHGGQIWADSPGPGMGATFTFALPRLAQP
jgi:two-component system, OmpR family, phosphate regulon sensor histidine kinase PhoR